MMTSVCIPLLHRLHSRAWSTGMLCVAGVRITFGKEVLPSPGSEENQIYGMWMRQKKRKWRDQNRLKSLGALSLSRTYRPRFQTERHFWKPAAKTQNERTASDTTILLGEEAPTGHKQSAPHLLYIHLSLSRWLSNAEPVTSSAVSHGAAPDCAVTSAPAVCWHQAA